MNQSLLKHLNETTVKGAYHTNLLHREMRYSELIPGAKEKTLDFYADLKGMPKWSEPSTQAAVMEAEDDAMESISGSTVSKPLTRREEARMKNKQNVLAKKPKVQIEPAGRREKVGTVRPFEDVEGDESETRETKRTKSVVESSGT